MCIERKDEWWCDANNLCSFACLRSFRSESEWEAVKQRCKDEGVILSSDCVVSENIYLRWTKQHQVHFRRCSNSQQFKPFLWQIKINILTNDKMFCWMIWWPFVNRSQFHENSDGLSMLKFAWTSNLLCLVFLVQCRTFDICRTTSNLFLGMYTYVGE